MKKRMKRKRHIVMRAALAADLPLETDGGMAKVTLLGHRRVLIENHRGVHACAEGGITLAGPEGLISVCGRELEIRELDGERMLAEGYITGVTYE